MYPAPGSVSTAKLDPSSAFSNIPSCTVSASATTNTSSLGLAAGSKASGLAIAAANRGAFFGSSFNIYVGARVALVSTSVLCISRSGILLVLSATKLSRLIGTRSVASIYILVSRAVSKFNPY